MISEVTQAEQAYVWVWLPGATEPVVAGRIHKQGNLHHFTYGRRYRERDDAIAFSPFELPLQSGTFQPEGLNTLHSCLRDAAPDAWGRRVVGYRFPGFNPDELDYLLLSGSDRIGALDFQLSSTEYVPRSVEQTELQGLLQAADMVDQRMPLPADLDIALLHGTSVGGARPKALISDEGRAYIAKFSSSTDSYDIVKAEYVAMQLAGKVGLRVASTRLVSVVGKDVLLVERFDRSGNAGGVQRRMLLSGLSLLGLNEMEARYASYHDLADLIRSAFVEPTQELHELYARLVFNILIGNTDDHARNHSAFWNGRDLSLTPAYDLCPQMRSGREAGQAMQIGGVQGNLSTLANVLSACSIFMLSESEARELIEHQIAVVEDSWMETCDLAGLGIVERERLWGAAIFNPFCFEGWR